MALCMFLWKTASSLKAYSYISNISTASRALELTALLAMCVTKLKGVPVVQFSSGENSAREVNKLKDITVIYDPMAL